MEQLLVIVRHGDYGIGSGDSPLSEIGLKQMQDLERVISARVIKEAEATGEKRVTRIVFSFSDLKRVFQSAQALRSLGEYIIVTGGLYLTTRDEIREPQKILEEVMGIAKYWGANVIVIVAHGQMPAVITETAHEFVTGKKLEQLPNVREACGYITMMSTGEVMPIRWDSLEEEKQSRPVVKGGPPRPTGVVIRSGPPYRPIDYPDDDIPF